MFRARATIGKFVVGRAVLSNPHVSNNSNRSKKIPPLHRQKGSFPALSWTTDDYPWKPYQGSIALWPKNIVMYLIHCMTNFVPF